MFPGANFGLFGVFVSVFGCFLVVFLLYSYYYNAFCVLFMFYTFSLPGSFRDLFVFSRLLANPRFVIRIAGGSNHRDCSARRPTLRGS